MPVKTKFAEPIILTLFCKSLDITVNEPCLKSTWTLLIKLPVAFNAATVAHAPLPHARVSPAPLSNTRNLIWSQFIISAKHRLQPSTKGNLDSNNFATLVVLLLYTSVTAITAC